MVIWCIYIGKNVLSCTHTHTHTHTARASILITIREQRQRTQNGLQFWIIFNAAYKGECGTKKIRQNEEHNVKASGWIKNPALSLSLYVCVSADRSCERRKECDTLYIMHV
jgi:hypothetical protein